MGWWEASVSRMKATSASAEARHAAGSHAWGLPRTLCVCKERETISFLFLLIDTFPRSQSRNLERLEAL